MSLKELGQPICIVLDVSGLFTSSSHVLLKTVDVADPELFDYPLYV
jgi:hypothetical protein